MVEWTQMKMKWLNENKLELTRAINTTTDLENRVDIITNLKIKVQEESHSYKRQICSI